MTWARLGWLLLLFLLIGVPLLLPAAQLLADPTAFSSLRDYVRLLGLAKNTFFLLAGTLALSVPLGTAVAVLLYRTDLPCRRPLRFVILWTLFIPLPLFASGWQTVLGSGGFLALPIWNQSPEADPIFAGPAGAWTPWGHGIGSAIWIHAVASLPWVVLLVGQGLRWVERDLEEDALMSMSPRRVFFRVTLVRCWAAIGAAALWVALQTATEITITDVMQVRTFAEEVYTQLVGPDVDPTRGGNEARAVAAALPFVTGVALLVLFTVLHWERRLPARRTMAAPPLLYSLGRWRWPLLLLTAVVVAVLFALPMVSLVGKAGWVDADDAWSARSLVEHVRLVWQTERLRLGGTLLIAATTGVVCAGLALLTCWLALDSPWFRWSSLILMATAWAMPGPLVGMGLKAAILLLLNLIELPAGPNAVTEFVADLLWHGPSPAPIVWVDVIRFFPCAVAVIWPVLRLLPRELRDAAAVDGAQPFRAFCRLILPLSWLACLRAALAVGVLSLGELSAGKLVSTPGLATFAEELFTQMHYGVSSDLAARCLLLLVAVGMGGILVLVVSPADESRSLT